MNKVWRPDLHTPNTFRLEVDLNMMGFLLTGLRQMIDDARREIRMHEERCGDDAKYCNVRHDNIIREYGTVDAAVSHGVAIAYSCMQDLAEMYMGIGGMMSYAWEIEDLINRPTERGDDPDEEKPWQPREKLQEIKAEVAHRIQAAKEDTGLLPIIKDDEEDGDAPTGSILGLTDNLPSVDGKVQETRKPEVAVETPPVGKKS